MATQTSPTAQPMSIHSPARDSFYQTSERQPSPQRKPLPTIPMSSPNERMHGAPVSPVKINFQSEDLSRKATSALIVDADAAQNSQETVSRLDSPQILLSPIESMDISKPERPQLANIRISTGIENDSPRKESDESSRGNGRPRSNGSSDVDSVAGIQPVTPLQYHHIRQAADDPRLRTNYTHSPSNENADAGAGINRRLTPNSPYIMRTSGQRPASSYSLLSEFGARGRSPNGLPKSPTWSGRAPSINSSGRSPDSRPLSMIDLLNTPYPQAAPPALTLDNSRLRASVGSNASLLSTDKTLELYRQNVKKTNDSSIQYAFAVFLISAAQELQADAASGKQASSTNLDKDVDPLVKAQELIRESRQLLQKLSDRSYPFAQYYLADGYASGLFSKGKEDYNTAFPLFIAASKHGHAESGYRAALCYEFGWGCRKDPAKAVQFYRQSASKNHPGAMTRLGNACLSGDLGVKNYREGLKWLKRAAESADPQYNAAPYHLGLLYEHGYGEDIFQDEAYAAQLFTQAADLGHAEAGYKMGDAYEYGKLACPRDPALSIHFYTGAAQKGHPAAMMALCAWYLVGAPPVLEVDENEAYEWARRAAEAGLVKAQYAMGYFTEMGIGCRRDPLEANVWYVKAAEAGDERAKVRIAAIQAAAAGNNPNSAAGKKGKRDGAGDKDKDCVVM